MRHVATINAFKNKFGSYTGAIRIEATKEVTRERFETYDDARNWVKARACDVLGPVCYASVPRKGEYFANCWQD